MVIDRRGVARDAVVRASSPGSTEVQSNLLCTICYARPADTAFNPCGHHSCRFTLIIVVLTASHSSLAQSFDNSTESPITWNSQCYPLIPGDIDFQTLDLIAVYRLDRPKATGVTIVQGSRDLQRAYRIGGGANLTMGLQQVFPNGLPHSFSVVGTFNSRGQRNPWSLIKTRSKEMLFSLTLLPKVKRLAVFFKKTKHMFASWELFTPGWHKLNVAVYNETIHVAVDCIELDAENITSIDIMEQDAKTVAIVSNNDGTPAPIDLQWLSLSCNMYDITNESCDEIENVGLITDTKPPYGVNTPTLGVCNGTCPPGPPGPIGIKGEAGLRGPTGLIGRRGIAGPSGSAGLKGDKGEPGLVASGNTVQGPPGVPGLQGPKGDKGESGVKGDSGNPGRIGVAGRDGVDGEPGPRGEKGLTGPPGPAANVNASLIRGMKGEKGSIGNSGRDGNPGDRGLPGTPGQPGAQGTMGMPGTPGINGLPGSQGPPGDRGFEGPQGIEGPAGKPGLPGPPGTSILGPQAAREQGSPGPQGETGSKGEPGQPGMPGRDGMNGVPGTPGSVGPPGIPAPHSQIVQSQSITESEIRNICEDLIRVRLREFSEALPQSQPGPAAGRRGLPGRPGSPGPQGIPGDTGETGPRGAPGEAGEPGKAGEAGSKGEKGDTGERGPQGIGLPGPEGQRGLPGPIGPPGSEGRSGPRGDPGREGPLGPRGVPGLRGSCDCPVAAYYSYGPGYVKGP